LAEDVTSIFLYGFSAAPRTGRSRAARPAKATTGPRSRRA
jgi:hypothetical protein